MISAAVVPWGAASKRPRVSAIGGSRERIRKPYEYPESRRVTLPDRELSLGLGVSLAEVKGSSPSIRDVRAETIVESLFESCLGCSCCR